MERLYVFDITCCFEYIKQILNSSWRKGYGDHIKYLNDSNELDCILIILNKDKPNKLLGLRKENKEINITGFGRPVSPKKLPDLEITNFSLNENQNNFGLIKYDVYYNKDYMFRFNLDSDLHKSIMMYIKKYIKNKEED